MTPQEALHRAVEAARTSPCAKSNRGVVVFHPVTGRWAAASNGPPAPFICDGSLACRAGCRDIAVHAEARAILAAFELHRKPTLKSFHLLHVKVVEGKAVPSGPPSCVRCSALILESGISKVYLLHEDGLKSYDAVEFHRLSLEHHGLPTMRAGAVAAPKAREVCTDINIAIGEIRITPWGRVMGATPPGGYGLRDRALFKAERGQPLTDAEREMLLAIANGLRAL